MQLTRLTPLTQTYPRRTEIQSPVHALRRIIEVYRDTRLSEQPEPTEHYIFPDSQTVVLECGFQWDSVRDRDPLEL
ncbi:hypothetical protein AB0D83_02450 [Streptomyces decoyicus]|uniref:hypothetical protein n=1 Tax=Streptomyces decoyicus TaxID=249567 RepID=UPI0033DF8586